MQTVILDLPPTGVHLSCERTPLFLRFTRSRKSREWDVLDQLDDTPREDEEVLATRQTSSGCVHVDGRDKQGRRFGRWLRHFYYTLLAEQPPEDVLRDNERWREWCLEQKEECNANSSD